MSRDKFLQSSLEITREEDQPVNNHFIQQASPSEKLALLFPGMRYTCDKPLLYYTTELLLSKGYDILQLRSDYGTHDFDQLSQSEKTIQIIADGQALLNAGMHAGNYKQVILCGKSLGTLTMAFILNADQDLGHLTTIWLTPLIHLPPVADAIMEKELPAFIAGSSADPTFSSGPLHKLEAKPNTVMFITDQADHSLEFPGDAIRSLDILIQVITKLSSFVS